jgi:geranylgeranyl diphosphate synthase, type II
LNNNLLNDFEEYLKNNLPLSNSFHPIFQDSLQSMLLASGKRFRPMLMLCIVDAINPLLVKNSMSIALALEYLHTYSLIHDDLPCMDDASLRRGHTTLHKQYDEATAVLVGDALNTHSFNLISNSPLSNDIKISIIKIVSNECGINGMIIGQAIDCYFENSKVDIKQLEFLHIHKTAKFIACALQTGAIICNVNKDLQNRLYNFGLDIGLLFQIQDDIIDKTSNQKEALKTTQNDINKNSFINLLGLKEAIKSANKLSTKCQKDIKSFDINIQNNLNSILLPYFNKYK